MSQANVSKTAFTSLFCYVVMTFATANLNAQDDIRSYVMFAGPNGTGTSLIGSSITINNGSVGAYKLVQTTGNATINANIYSGDKVIITNSNVINGRIAAGNSSNSSGTILSVGSSTLITGNIDVNGNIVIGGGTVSGTVTLPVGKTYTGPVPAGDTVFGTPSIPILPVMPAPAVFPEPPAGYPINNYTTSQSLVPGWYGNITYGGNRTLTLNGPGVYVFNSFQWTGNSNKLVFDFQGSTTGRFYIYIHGNADFGKLNASLANGGSAARIYAETHGDGTGTSIAGNSFIIANGSSGGGSKWQGTVYATNAGVNIGSGTGSSTLTGALHSTKHVLIQSGVTLNYSAFSDCTPPNVNAGTDVPLNFFGQTTLTATSTTSGATFSWQAINGGTITSTNTNTPTITVSSAGTYIVTAAAGGTCTTKDTVIVTAAVRNVIGSELLSIYQSYVAGVPTPPSPFFTIQNNYVKIDVIVFDGKRQEVLDTLTKPTYGLINIYPSGLSPLTITGDFPIANLLKLNTLPTIINYCRPYYLPYTFSERDTLTGLVKSAGDTTIKTHVVRPGYRLNGEGVKIGVISDSYNTILSGTTPTLPLQPVRIPPYIIDPVTLDTVGTFNPIPQTFRTQTAAQDIGQGDLPGDTLGAVNPNGYLKNVHVLQDFPIQRTDEGRAMLQIIHDVAPAAELYFRTGFFTPGDFANGIRELKDAGCKIIVDDITYVTESFLKDGIIARTVNEVKDQGITYFSAAGNFGNKSYEKDFNGADATSIGFPGKKAHNFASTGTDFFQHLKLKPGNYTFVFQWVDDTYSIGETAGTQFDMDIFLSKNTDGTGLIGFNRDNFLGDPIEFIPITILGDSPSDTTAKDYHLLIVNNTLTGDPSRIKYIAFRGEPRFMEYNEGNSTIVGQANATGAIAIGAGRFNHVPGHPNLPAQLSGITKPQIERFSSRGGTVVNTLTRQKPDLTGPDGVNTTVKLGQDYPDWVLDGFSNFFGTSAAAPHAAGAAALIMQGRKRYLTGQPETSPDEIKTLFQSTAVSMRPAGLVGYDFNSGSGMIDADSAMRTFAAPTPFQIQLVVPPSVIPGETEFTLKITGQNFSNNTVIYFNDSVIQTEFINKNELSAIIGTFEGNPEIKAYTEPKTNFDDGGFSNSLYFFDANIVVTAVGFTKKYGEDMPALLDTIITINDTLLQNSSYTLEELGLSNLSLTTSATKYSNVGTYAITPSRTFNIADPDDLALLKKYNYTFTRAFVTIDQLPIKVTPNDKTIVYGKAVGNISYTYSYENGTQITDAILLHKLDSSYDVYKPDNTLAVINNYPGSTGLTDNDLVNLSGMVTFEALKNSRKFEVVNGSLVPLPANSTLFNIQYLVDVSAQALLNYKNDPASVVLVPSYPGVNSRAIVGAAELAAGEVQVSANPLGQMVNGVLVKTVNSPSGSLAAIYTNSLLQMIDGVQVSLNSNGDLVPIANESLVQLSNGVLVKTVNGELQPLANNVLVKLVDNTLVQMANGVLVKSVNGLQTEPVLNGVLVKTVNGVLVKTVNGVDEAVANNTLILMANGVLVKTVNNILLQMVNGIEIPLANTSVQVVNGVLVKSVNGTDVPITSGLLEEVGGNVVQVVNSFSVSEGNNEDAAVIIDSDDIAVENGFLGAMFSTNMITGLTIGEHTLIGGTLINSNFKISYGIGHATVVEDSACILTHSPFKNFGNTTLQPTSLWLNLTTKVSGQLAAEGDYLLFKSASVTFNNIASSPLVNNLAMPNGKIVATGEVTAPTTHYDAATNTWITRVPLGFASTSDIFVMGAIINSSNGFVKINGNTSSVVKGAFYSNKPFTDQWGYGIAAYQLPVADGGPYVPYSMLANEGDVISINGNYRAGTPVPILSYLVQGASGGGGNNYTGSTSSFQTYTACVDPNPLPTIRVINSSLTLEVDQNEPAGPGVLINPNPASGYINVSFVPLHTGRSRIEIFTINGRKVFEADYGICEAGNKYIKQIDVNKLLNGIYLVRVWNAGKVTNKKIVIAR